jgi:Lar family restriction alleviation protein
MMDKPIKPCPFCGNRESTLEELKVKVMCLDSGEPLACKHIYCWQCGAVGPLPDRDEDIIERWNNALRRGERWTQQS